MSITLIKQNVSRYSAPQPTTPSHYCLQDVECVSISHVRFSFLEPVFDFTSIISHLVES